MFQGATELHLDNKGRLPVPSVHRDALRLQGEGRLVLTAHPHRCLLLYPRPAWEPVRAELMARNGLDRRVATFQRLLVGHARDMEMDAAGRILISPELRKYAGLDKAVMLVGQGSHFEIWDLATWDRQLDELSADDTGVLPQGMENFSL